MERRIGQIRSDRRKELEAKIAYLAENNPVTEAIKPVIGGVREIVFNPLQVARDARRRALTGK